MNWYAKVDYSVTGIGSFDSTIEVGPCSSKETCESLIHQSIDDAKEVFGDKYKENSYNVWEC